MTHYGKALVLGLGASGMAAAELLASEGARVTVVDSSAHDGLSEKAEKLRKQGAEVGLGAVRVPDGDFDVCVTSPGIPSDSEWIREVESRGIVVLSELELGASRCRCPIAAVTGSNGKSTLVKLCGEALAVAGSRVELAGNYGEPLSGFAMRSDRYDWVVAEVSSFQLEKVRTFRPKVGALLNVNPNHLNRHGDFMTYVKIKSRLFACMGPKDTGAVVDTDIEAIRNLAGGQNPWVTFGLSEHADYQYKEGVVRYRRGNDWSTVSVPTSMFANDVMGVTAAAAVAVVESCGVDGRCVETAVRKFKPLPHRMNLVGIIDDVKFVDDSKATNLAAMVAALEMCDRPVRLIAGGLLKEGDLAPAANVLRTRVKGVYLIGAAAPDMAKAWGHVVPCRLCERLDRAFHEAWHDTRPGETILLSPACASFDQFSSFEERGCRFVELVGTIKGDIG